MTKIFKVPFADTGDKISPPDAIQPDGSVSYGLGYGFDYQRDTSLDSGGAPIDPLAKVFPREQHNGILNDITTAIGEIQSGGLPVWQSIAGPYPINALVRFSGSNWRSTTANNTSQPGQPGASWIDPNFQPYANTAAPGIVQLSTNQEAIGGTENSKAATSLRVAEYVASQNLQKNLGYTPVQQGTGIGQSQNTVKIGWSASDRLRLTVDTSDRGLLITSLDAATETSPGSVSIATQGDTNLGTNDSLVITPKKLRAGFNSLFGDTGYLVFPSWLGSFMIQWGTFALSASPSASQTVTFPLSFSSAPKAWTSVNGAATEMIGLGSIGVLNMIVSKGFLDNTPRTGSWFVMGRG